MARISNFGRAAAAALVFAGCAGDALANGANIPDATEQTAPAASTRNALTELENSAYEAWKSKDAAFWGGFLSDRFVGWASSGRLDRTSAAKEYTGADCEIKRYAFSDEQIKPLGNDAALITHRTTVEGSCGGQRVPADSWGASIYVRDGANWKGAFHAEAAIVDPKVAAAKTVDRSVAPHKQAAKLAARDARTDTMLALERAVWEAWRVHDVKTIGELTARDITFINIFGTYFANKADALKDWGAAGCDVNSISISDAMGTMLSPTVEVLTFKATADGTCYGQAVGPIWGSSVYLKEGDTWKWTFGINLPAGR
jgi:hypothetical protein